MFCFSILFSNFPLVASLGPDWPARSEGKSVFVLKLHCSEQRYLSPPFSGTSVPDLWSRECVSHDGARWERCGTHSVRYVDKKTNKNKVGNAPTRTNVTMTKWRQRSTQPTRRHTPWRSWLQFVEGWSSSKWKSREDYPSLTLLLPNSKSTPHLLKSNI